MMSSKTKILINDSELTEAQTMTLHVALQLFSITLTDPEFKTGLGNGLASSYIKRIVEIELMFYKG